MSGRPPSVFRALRAAVGIRWHVERLLRRSRLTRTRERIARASGGLVLAGPFTGLRYPPQLGDPHAVPKLVGSYERELHPWLAALARAPYDRVLNVGCADGWYAVGFARAIPAAEVHAFDVDPLARWQTRRNARRNRVGARVHTHGWCDHVELTRCAGARTLVFVDCEGCEDALLDPAAAPSLRAADVVVELHEDIVPGVEARLRERFATTHRVAAVTSAGRNPADYPALAVLAPADAAQAVNEWRVSVVPQRWLLLTRAAS